MGYICTNCPENHLAGDGEGCEASTSPSLSKRLRLTATCGPQTAGECASLLREAADKIEQLEAEVERLKAEIEIHKRNLSEVVVPAAKDAVRKSYELGKAHREPA